MYAIKYLCITIRNYILNFKKRRTLRYNNCIWNTLTKKCVCVRGCGASINMSGRLNKKQRCHISVSESYQRPSSSFYCAILQFCHSAILPTETLVNFKLHVLLQLGHTASFPTKFDDFAKSSTCDNRKVTVKSRGVTNWYGNLLSSVQLTEAVLLSVCRLNTFY